ncbi:UDP-N-acetylglucosamine-N-acetylmuramylpentapeptide N-acetylglucosamine transferase [Sporobacter termitidis DSM 10068]|uniref:UDP-N-acetylglucosamine--N-acetylmuramyl-(pentapeptide) pyrophosphoryl-undecaprenol N-acetylglucosamine transferase n=1 Tax=Sporobacter termitidis DSM 10068 TaxID=1123282 RepID=A0A1M5X061_9FIRM|nr:UDP-N-acetylglucosamine--N-acetylmuramyl-(pentapeptide) pyrophosphoryl-undecaprenol N-acetylglucosamine transferase [Sporobacter termitidis]SHH92918.1 UDP-N-acetylglucosamine-N-acetylmuramylpentapeptide N-acetylglucosamine transferase [Sporobacter termitidis DSM 10068]
MRFLFTCGGTAGHINPALALADEIKRTMPDSKILFVGSGRRMENRLIPQAGYDIKNIKISGFERGVTPNKLIRNFKNLRSLASAAAQSSEIIRIFTPDVAIGTGGYVCYPVLKKAAQLGIPTILHESNAVPGLTTKMLMKTVDKVLVAFPGVENQYRYPGKVIFTGTPVRGSFLTQTKHTARMALGVDGRPLVVSFWGSLGAEKMNEVISDFIALDIESRLFNHIHATGGNDAVMAALKKRLHDKTAGARIPEWIDIRTYIDNMAAVMAASDLILCRGGASTLAELALMGKPAVIVPSPNVTNNHQEKNALQLAKIGGAVVMYEKDCTGETLYQTVKTLLADKSALNDMAAAMKKAGVPDSANKIVDLIISMC